MAISSIYQYLVLLLSLNTKVLVYFGRERYSLNNWKLLKRLVTI